MLKIYKQITKTAFMALVVAIFMIPSMVSAGGDNYYGDFSVSDDYGWNYGSGSYSQPVSYTNWTYEPVYGGFDYPSYNTGSFSAGSSYYPSFNPSFSTPSFFGSSFGGSSIPSSNLATSNNVSSSNSTSSSSATAINNNVNNVYVYTNPTGNAVVHNPQHQYLNAYCVITPANPRTGQTVTATAYATGGIGNYSYTWGGDIYQTTGVSTSFTSYTVGTKTISVTVRSDQEVITKTCTVTFVNDTFYNSNPTQFTGSSVNISGLTSGTPVSGVFLGDLPATGLSLGFLEYMIAFMVIILASVFTFVYQAKKRLTAESI